MFGVLGNGFSRLGLGARLRASVVLPPVAANVDWFATNGSSAAFGDASGPSSVYDPISDKTFIAFEAWDGFQRVVQADTYDHSTGSWMGSATVGINPLKNDNHGQPAIALAPDGHLVVVYGAHHNPLRVSTSVNPRDASQWSQKADATGALTYPYPIFVGSDLWLFARHNAGDRMVLFSFKATNVTGGNVSFGPSKTMASYEADTRFYIGEVLLGPDGFIWLLSARANLADTERQDVYVLRINPATGDVSNTNGSVTVLSANLPVLRAQLDASYRLIEVPGTDNTVPRGCFDTAGDLHILTAAGDNVDLVGKHYKYSGGVLSAPTDTFNIGHIYSGQGVARDGDGIEIFATETTDETRSRGGSVYKRTRSAAGVWGPKTLVRAEGDLPLLVSKPVINARPELRWTFSEIPLEIPAADFDNDRTAGDKRVFAYGSDGLVKRPEQTAITLSAESIPADATVGSLAALIMSPRPRETLTLSNGNGQFAIDGRNLNVASALTQGTYNLTFNSSFRGIDATSVVPFEVGPPTPEITSFEDLFNGEPGQPIENREGWDLASGSAGAWRISSAGTQLALVRGQQPAHIRAPDIRRNDNFSILIGGMQNGQRAMFLYRNDLALPENGFRIFVHNSSNKLRIEKVVNGVGSFWEFLVPSGKNVLVEVVNSQFTVKFDGVLQTRLTGPEQSLAGNIPEGSRFYVKEGLATNFDNVCESVRIARL